MGGVRATAAVLTLLVSVGIASPAHAAITVGEAGTPAGSPNPCVGPVSLFQPSVASGPDYRVPPGGGVITSWQTFGDPSAAPPTNAAFLLAAEPLNGVKVIFRGDTQPVALGVNSFPIRLPVAGGERIGLLIPTGSNGICSYQLSATSFNKVLSRAAEPTIGVTEAYGEVSSRKANVSAVIEDDDDKDGFGDDSQDSCPIDGSIQVPCGVEIDSNPRKKTSKRKGTFSFSVPAGQNISFECRLDRADFAPCQPPFTVKKLKARKHTFRVRGKDASGQVGTESAFRWRVTD